MPIVNFSLQTEYIALNDLLKATGVAQSGGEGKALVAQGIVKVDGKQETRKTAKIRAGQKVAIDTYFIHVSA